MGLLSIAAAYDLGENDKHLGTSNGREMWQLM